ncbi:hypothetical protein HK100_001900 [Physocladia obscura]|uniref:GATA-type domain-containing protein n=1 Tax=Physocladia obscura TaxID=109957 RepID=A0AAD5XBH1_9FUNG|nr:hypothetical protein HK100_001900 [Physocladia obscura]
MHYDSPQRTPPLAASFPPISAPVIASTAVPPPGRKSAKGPSTIKPATVAAALVKRAAAVDDEEINSPPSNFGEDRISGGGSSKSRPMKPGHCRKCGKTSSREWRKGPHGPKTLCNACGLRFKRKPWEIPAETATVATATAEEDDSDDGIAAGVVGSLLIDVDRVHIEAGPRICN